MEFSHIKTAYAGLCLFGDLRRRGVGCAIARLLDSLDETPSAFAVRYAALFPFTLAEGGLSGALEREIMRSSNLFAQQSRSRPLDALDPPLLRAAQYDIGVLGTLRTLLVPHRLLEAAALRYPEAAQQLLALPEYDAGPAFRPDTPEALYAFYRQRGYGLFSGGCVFRRQNGEYRTIAHPDPVRLSDLKRYERQKQIIVDNTRLLLSGKRANNLLLYGDRGTGKSSSVKAVANAFSREGLKLLELGTQDLADFSAICADIASSPFSFIVFLDDLSFARPEDSIPLKAALEGGAAKAPDNLAVYATSNRRHLTEEHFSDRMGDEIHMRDSIEALCSFSDRFGIEVVFQAPGRNEYHDIVRELARDHGLLVEEGTLLALADQFALQRGVRSPRTACQFITHLYTQDLQQALERH